jgi:hypothetical protein
MELDDISEIIKSLNGIGRERLGHRTDKYTLRRVTGTTREQARIIDSSS